MKSDGIVSEKSAARQRANEVKPYRCKNLIVVLETPSDIKISAR